MSVNTTSSFQKNLQKDTVKSTVPHQQKKRRNANAAEVSALMESMMGVKPKAAVAPMPAKPAKPKMPTSPTRPVKPTQTAETPPSVVETQRVEPQLNTEPVTAVADDHNEEPIHQDEVSLENEESAAASFLPQTQAHGGKSTQQKPKDVKSHSSQDIDPGLALLIQKAMAARAMVAEQKDVALSIQAASDSEFEAVFRQENPTDQGFISTETFRATKQKQGRLNVAAYIRVSTDSTDQEYSYETQERYFNQLIENHPDWNAVGVYSDYGISGTSSDKRTGFKRLMRHCGEGKIDRVVCKSISRFARNTTDFMTALRTLRENNTTILFEKENLDTADPTSEFILTTLGAIAQEESRSISGNITLGNKMRFKRGDVRNEVIYGYRYNGEMVTSASGYQYKDVEIVEEEAEIVRRIFREVADGAAYVEIAKTICHAEKVYEEQIIRVVRRAVIERFELTVQPIQDDVKVADILSGRFAETEGVFSSEADSFVVQMLARLENIQRLDFMERDRTFYKRQITALFTSVETARKRVRLLQSQKDALETRRYLLGDMTVEETSITEKGKQIEELKARIERDDAEGKKLSEQLDYLESYWAELEDDFDRREDAIEWMKTLPEGCAGTAAFLNGLTGDYCKSFILSITVHSPLKFTIHWFDDTRTEVVMFSNIEDYRYTASYFDGVAMRDNAYRKRFVKKK